MTDKYCRQCGAELEQEDKPQDYGEPLEAAEEHHLFFYILDRDGEKLAYTSSHMRNRHEEARLRERIILTMNACAGIPNEQLEDGLPMDTLEEVTELLDELDSKYPLATFRIYSDGGWALFNDGIGGEEIAGDAASTSAEALDQFRVYVEAQK